MPIFEYRCEQCGNIFEEITFGNDVPPCPSCGSSETEKLISRPCRYSDGSASSASSGGCGCSGCHGGHCSSCGGH
ncbi:MAG: zinc ribbon domain-containing protein [Desulfovibrionaceae bacterium]|nr:zinc ribbon domain-containing protein [Desulfovibrionaceae bacterium]